MFFQGKQVHFFKPLYITARERYAFALKAIYERLYGPESLSSQRFDRQTALETLERAISQAPATIAAYDDPAGLPIPAGQLDAAVCLRELEEAGWLETYTDAASVTKTWRLTAIGKKFARQLWELEHPPARTRHRNMRSCAAALKAYVESGDADELLDARGYAEQVVEELTSDIEAFREQAREIARTTALRQLAVARFREFITERFRKEHAPRLVADSVIALESSIKDSLQYLRELPGSRREQYESQLQDRVVLEVHQGSSVLDLLVNQIERLVRNAVRVKVPELIDGYDRYIERMVSLIRQVSSAGLARADAAYDFAAVVKAAGAAKKERLLDALSELLDISSIRLYDPESFNFTLRPPDLPPSSSSIDVPLDPESILQAKISRAFEDHLAFSDNDTVLHLVRAAAARVGVIRLSQLEVATARDLLLVLAGEGAIHTLSQYALMMPLEAVADTPYFKARDIEFTLLEPGVRLAAQHPVPVPDAPAPHVPIPVPAVS